MFEGQARNISNVGGEHYSLALSEAHALSVQAWLAQHGVPVPGLSHKGYGSSQPIANKCGGCGRVRNRRVTLRKLNFAHAKHGV